MNPWHLELAKYPTWITQFDPQTSDGQPANDMPLSCWAAASSGIILHHTGKFVLPDTVKDFGIGPGTGGGNSAVIAKVLSHWGVPNSTVTPVGQALLKVEYDHLMKGHALIVDRHLHSPENTALHWCTIIGQIGHDFTVDSVILHDPETGSRIVETVANHMAMAYAISPSEYLLVCEE